MREGGRPRLIIDFQAERAVPKQSAECKPCAKVRVTDTPARRYITFFFPCPHSTLSYFSPCLSGPCLPFLFCCAALYYAVYALRCAGTYCTVSPSVLGTQAKRQGRAGQGRAG